MELNGIELIIGLLFVMVLLVALARKLGIPYPIFLVLAGLVLGFVPGLPKIELQPSMILILFLPPILQSSAYYMPVRDFRANLRSIGLLAIGLVLVSMVAVALVAHALIDGLPWGAAFLLGAIVAPPDAVAASSIAQRLHLPRRIVTVLEGESLLNDATALVAYRVALASVTTGVFSFLDAGGQFLYASLGGVAVGLAVGFAIKPLFSRLLNDSSVYLIMTFLSGYVAYLLAETFHFSSVLAVVTLGVLYSLPRFNTMTAELRIQSTAVWEVVVFLLNGLIFILIGLQMGAIVERLDGEAWTLTGYAVAICLTVILVRIVWVFPATYLPRVPRKVRERDPFPPWQHVAIVSWTGMRGVVSLAIALALPLTIENGSPFPRRDLIIFLTFMVILSTLVLQGLTLPLLIRWLKVVDDGGAEKEENKARLKAAHAGRLRLNELSSNDWVADEVVAKLTRQYEARIRRFSDRYTGNGDGTTEAHFANFERLEDELLQAEREAVLKLRNDEVINDEVLRRVERDIDLEWLRLHPR